MSFEERLLFCAHEDGPGVVVGGDSCQGGQKTMRLPFLGGLRDVSCEQDRGGENFIQVWYVEEQG